MRVLTAVCTAGLIWLTGIVTAVSAAAPTPTNTATVGTSLAAGSQLTSASRAYETVVQHDGNVVTYGPRGVVWNTATHGTAVRLAVQHDGNVVVYAGSRAVWNSRTSQSGASNRLTLTNSGVLELIGKYGIVWSSRIGNRCGSNGAARAVLVSVHDQLAGFCEGSRQVLTSPVTTGASALGDGTPLGSWAVYAKARDTWLYPAGGGAYFVHYWMPYSGAYGVHDSPWQSFAYGSQQYVTRGSHGCIHLPGSVMAWFYGWAPVGTAVRVTA